MTPDRSREAPAERFAADSVFIDLHAEAAALRTEQAASGKPHAQKTLFKHGGRTIALFVLSAGGGLPEHAANGTVSLQSIEGELDLSVAGESRRLAPGSLLIMAPGTPHDVRAAAPAVFLLQISLVPA